MLQQFHIAHLIGLCKTYLVSKFEVSSFKNGWARKENVADAENGLGIGAIISTNGGGLGGGGVVGWEWCSNRRARSGESNGVFGFSLGHPEGTWGWSGCPASGQWCRNDWQQEVQSSRTYVEKGRRDVWRCNLAIFEARDLKFSHQVGLAKPDSMSYVKLL